MSDLATDSATAAPACTSGGSGADGARAQGRVNGQVVAESLATGAIVAGRGTFEPAGGWGGDHHDGVPIWVLSRRDPGHRRERVAAGHLRQRRHECDDSSEGGCGRQNVLVHGAATAQLALAAGVLDELELHVIPVLFGQGRRLFEGLAAEQIELERTRILEGEGGVTHMHYRVRR